MNFLRYAGAALSHRFPTLRRAFDWLWLLQHRERTRLSEEMMQMRGLMPLLMKQRNGYRWSEDDRKKIRLRLRRLMLLSPYLILFLLPGGLLALPILAWWLDRRRQRRIAEVKRPSIE